MKKIILTALILIPAAVWAQSGDFILKGKVGDVTSAPGKAYLMYNDADKLVVDSAEYVKGAFSFKGKLKEPILARVVLDHQRIGLWKLGRSADNNIIYLEKGIIQLSARDSVKYAGITGSSLNDDYVAYKTLLAPPEAGLNQLNAAFKAAPAERQKEQSFRDDLQAKANQFLATRKLQQQQFIKQHPQSFVSLMVLSELAEKETDITATEALFKGLSAEVRATETGQTFAKKFTAAKSTAIGSIAPDFTLNDVNDKPVSLASFRGKYLLLDFWASWCGPCRGENPNVVKAYQQYRDKNFTILGVSLDRPGKKDAWLAAIKADGLEWTQVSDLKFWQSDVVKLYGIDAIPQNYLIDPTGKIIGRNLRGEDLNKTLAALLK